MPDRWGRPTMNDGLTIMNGLRTIQGFNDHNQQKEHDGRVRGYVDQIAKGESIDPKGQGYNGAAHLEADGAWQANKAKILQNQAAEAEGNQTKIDTTIAQAAVAEQSGDLNGAAKMLYPLYNFVTDGNTYEGLDEKTNEVLIRGADDKVTKYPGKSLEDLKKMAKGLSTNYITANAEAQQKRIDINTKAAQDWGLVTNKNGKALYRKFFLDKEGRPRMVYEDPRTQEFVGGFNYKTGKVVPLDGDYRSQEYWKQKAETEKAKITKREITKKQAIDMVPKIRKELANIDTISEFTQLMTVLNPEYADQVGKTMDPKEKREMKTAMKRKLREYQKYLPEDWEEPLNPNDRLEILLDGESI